MTTKRTEGLVPGVWGIVATPFQGSTFDIDEESLATLVEHYERIGATGLAVLGVFGEAASLTAIERETVMEVVVESTTLPLVVGVASLHTRPALEESRLALETVGDRLAAVMVQINSARPNLVVDHLTAIHDTLGVKIVLQDYPAVSGVSVSSASVAAIVRACPFVIAVKSEAPPTNLAIAELRESVDVPVFGGLGGQNLLDELLSGAAGAMTGFSYPEGLIACVDAWQSGGFEAAHEALSPYLPLINFEQQPRIALAVRKELLRQRGFIKESGARLPTAAFPEILHGSLVTHREALERDLLQTSSAPVEA
ncbi:dihydrodipicolinate synthase family protein [Rhodococcus qingshengii]|uniref:dihydrodipicolinate synthase family protein n=1 Tax=Rhodococcus qingshengii TaxID=334542 RepID=UPI003602A816